MKMGSTAHRFVAIVGLICAMNGITAETVEHVNSWGDLNAQVILGSTKSKIGIPFLQRSIELAYPEDFNIDGPEASLNTVKGIKHTETLNKADCHPTSEIVKGGVDQNFATVKITSARGCELNSLVEFYIERQLFQQEFKNRKHSYSNCGK